MRFVLFGTMLLAWAAQAQIVIPPEKVQPEWREMTRRANETRLDCRVGEMKPFLNFSLRFQTGYVVSLPLRQFRGTGNWFGVLLRVTPEAPDASPTYLFSRLQLPEVPETNAVLEFGGGFVVGEGKYRTEFLLMDQAGRVCTDDWRFQAKLGRKERNVEPGIQAGGVDEISLRKWTRTLDTLGGGSNDVTVLLNAAPLFSRRVRLGGYDRVVLISALASMLERMPVRKVRLIVFSMEKQKEIFRSEDFQASEFNQVVQALGRLELGVIDYETLQNRNGHVGLVTSLFEEALKGEAKQNAVIVLSPPTRFGEKVPPERLPTVGAPRVFYLQFRGWIGAVFNDTLHSAVRSVNGKKFDIYSPSDFAEALGEVLRALAARQQ